MSRPRIALLSASFESEATRRNFRRELDADLVEFDATAGDLPDSFGYDAAVVTGSRASVYEGEAWIDALLGWLGEADDRGLPMLGVCFGHQALAAALGGTVEAMGEYELGYREIHTVGSSWLLQGIEDRFVAFTTHSDTVTELPPDAEPIAENDYGLQGFQRGRVVAVQFHPEYDMAMARRVTERKDLPEERIRAVLEGITEENYAAACRTKRLFDDFVAHVESVGADAAAD